MKAMLAALVLLPTFAHADPTSDAPVEIDGPPGAGRAATDLDAPPRARRSPVVDPDQPPVPVHVEPPVGIAARSKLPAADRGLFAGTALTVPSGSAEVTVRALVPAVGVVTLAGGITDTTEIWADAGMAFDAGAEGSNLPGTYGVGITQVMTRSRSAQLAFTGGMHKVSNAGSAPFGDGFTTVGVAASVCLDGGCNVLVSGTASLMVTGPSRASSVMFTGSVSLGGGGLHVLGEAISISGKAIGFFGLRLGEHLALDLGVARTLGDGRTETIPMLGVTARL